MAGRLYGEKFYQARLISLALIEAVGRGKLLSDPKPGIELVMTVGYTFAEAESILSVFLSTEGEPAVIM